MPTDVKNYQPIAELLIKKGLVKEDQLDEVTKEAQKGDKSWEDLLLERDLVSEHDLTKLKGELLGLPYADLGEETISKDVLNIIPPKVAENYQMVAFQKDGRTLHVGMVDPQNFKAIEAVEFLAKDENLHAKYHIISTTDFKKIFKQYGALKQEAEEALAGVHKSVIDIEKKAKEGQELSGIIKSAPVSKMVLVIIRHAIDGRASDIHIEPQVKETRIRYRVDGILHTTLVLPKYIHAAIVARIKVLANLKLDETRKPQDGRIRLSIEGRDIDFRVSSLPLFEGEKIVMRVLDTKAQRLTLKDLGFHKRHISMIEESIKKTNGTMLVTGPTGSGKTTTLYSLLTILNKEGVNIITLEDPVEYYIDGINQSQINPEVGYTFATGLRSILRQDPNIIMLGEIRDQETADLVVHASLTGHLVLTTLHTNSAAGAVPRLLDMGVEPFLLSSTINVIVAQRLARRICSDCKEEAKVPDDIRKKIEPQVADIPKEYMEGIESKPPYKFYKGKGCSACGNKGYQGRIVVAEVLRFDTELQQIVARGFKSEEVSEALKKQNFISLRQESILKAIKGETSLEEVFRVTQL